MFSMCFAQLEKQEWKRANPGAQFRPIDEEQYRDRTSNDVNDELWNMSVPNQIEVARLVPELRLPFPPRILLRSTFHWVPSRVHFSGQTGAKFVDHINFFPRTPKTEAM